MENKRFIVLVASLTVIFSVAMVVCNLMQMPPAPSATAVANTVSYGALFVGSSSEIEGSAAVNMDGSDVHSTAPATSRTASKSKASAASRKSSAMSVSVSFPLNLNKATAQELDALPGIGPVLAQRIVDYRAQNGAFISVDQLKDVKGIGDKIFEKLRPDITTG